MSTLPSSSSAAEKSCQRASAMLLVECPNHLFGRSISMLNSGGSVGSSSMALTRRIPIANLRYTTFYHGFRMVDDMALKSGDNCSVPKESAGEIKRMVVDGNREIQEGDPCGRTYLFVPLVTVGLMNQDRNIHGDGGGGDNDIDNVIASYMIVYRKNGCYKNC
mmetsp:Transcript_27939/g.33074  ORF Transcript_27939/g.33074 Transcript_27939/m.33074 type:complete len:163 (-) Transcript_27939:50-538(-)